MTLRVRWLGRVAYRDALALQHGLFDHGSGDHLLLLEHPHVYTLGVRADPGHVLVEPGSVGAELVRADRGGDVTYHGPGQLVGYPILDVPGLGGGGKADTVAYVRQVEQLVIDTLADLGLAADRLPDYPGVWVGVDTPAPRKIAAIGVRLTRGRSMHGFALNVAPDLAMFGHIVPCGIADKAVTSLAAEGFDVPMRTVVDVLVRRAVATWGTRGWERTDVAWRTRPDDLAPFSRGHGPGAAEPSPRRERRLVEAGVTEGLSISARKPEWARARVSITPEYLSLKRTMRELSLVTVCEEAGCPNIFECWADGTATFMINGERCTRACGFCLVDTRHPEALDPGEPERVAEAVERMGLSYAVVTAVARDDLADGGAAGFAATVDAVRRRAPHVQIEVLVPDCKGDPAALAAIFDARPDVLNHNVETVPRLQRAVRPSASYARSLSVLARAKEAGLVTKSGLIVGLGEDTDEVHAVLADLHAVGVDIVTVGQYLRPTTHHLPVVRWWTPDELAAVARHGEALGIGHVEATPLTRSSHHARQAAATVLSPARAVSIPYADRLARVRAAMAEGGIDVLLLSVGPDLPWLCGYEAMPLERLTMLVVGRDAPATLVVPRLEVPRVVERGDLFTITAWDETDDPVRIVADHMGPAVVAAIGDRTWARFLVELQQATPGTRYERAAAVVGPLRATKDPAEVDALRSAAAAADRVAAELQAGDIALVGRTEAEVSADIGRRLLAEGHHRVNFAIVAAGESAASPHHEAGARRIGRDEVVLCDFGGTLAVDDGPGYCSDITRCVVTGTPAAEVVEAYELLATAQAAARAAATVGTPCEQVDLAARSVIAAGGRGDYFVHRTGHGIGIEEHEDPYIVAGNASPLAPGHAFSVEPGIYLPGRFGLRLEDILVASEAGPESLNRADRSLVSVEA